MQTEQIGKMMIYACGGAGINIGSYFQQFQDIKTSEGFAQMNVVFIDTSASNFNDTIKQGNTYLVEGLDGSGKIRAENHREIAESIHDILMKYPPGDINIVISSASGGSGSVITPSLVSELLKRDKNVIVSNVVSTDSRIEIENSVKTMRSFEAIAQLRKQPVAIIQYENSSESSRSAVNDKARSDIEQVAALFSKQNKELDSADLKNWINYTKVTKVEAKPVLFNIAHGQVEANRAHILSVATLAYEGMNTAVGSPVDYQCVGYVSQGNEQGIKLTAPIHYLMLDNIITDTYLKLAKQLADMDEANLARKRTGITMLGDSDKIQDDGLVL